MADNHNGLCSICSTEFLMNSLYPVYTVILIQYQHTSLHTRSAKTQKEVNCTMIKFLTIPGKIIHIPFISIKRRHGTKRKGYVKANPITARVMFLKIFCGCEWTESGSLCWLPLCCFMIENHVFELTVFDKFWNMTFHLKTT